MYLNYIYTETITVTRTTEGKENSEDTDGQFN